MAGALGMDTGMLTDIAWRGTNRAKILSTEVKRASRSPSLHDSKIDPLSGQGMLLACQGVVDDDLKAVFARRQISTELNHAARQQPFQIGLAGYLKRIFVPGEHRFAVSKQANLCG